MRPVVGVMPLWDDEKESLWMLPGYMDGIRSAGAIPVVLPLTESREDIVQLSKMCDGFLFTGGHDVCPNLYGEEEKAEVVCCPQRDNMEKIFLDIAIAENKPVLGICRGIQFINAALGGTLWQDIKSFFKTDINHHQTPPYDVPVHDVSISEDTPLYECLKSERISVNSYHHQAVKDLAPDLEVMARSDDGLTEAVYMPSQKFFWAVQWHPEFSFEKDPDSRRIFEAFVDSMLPFDFKWTDGKDEDFGRFYLKTEEYYSSIVGGIENRTGFIPYNISDQIPTVLMAYENGKAVACAGLKKYSETDVEIKRVWVEHEARRKGIARIMMEKLENRALSLGFDRLILQTRPQMEDAVALYKKLGYTLTDNYPPYDKLEGAICFAKEVGHDNA